MSTSNLDQHSGGHGTQPQDVEHGDDDIKHDNSIKAPTASNKPSAAYVQAPGMLDKDSRGVTLDVPLSPPTLDSFNSSVEAIGVYDGRKLLFVPEQCLKNVVTQIAVEQVLRHEVANSSLKLTTPISELAEFYSKKSFKLFAIIARYRALRLTEHFYQNGFKDEMLPVQLVSSKTNTKSLEVESCASETTPDSLVDGEVEAVVRKVFQCGYNSPWGDDGHDIQCFCEWWQWPYVSPIFAKEGFRYKFSESTCLPFLSSRERKVSESNYSFVEETIVHIDHLPKDLNLATDDKGNHRVAIKQLKRHGREFELRAEAEAHVLELMKGIEDEHLIKAIAYYQKGRDFYFMFPWAEAGNLRDYWGKSMPKMDKDYIIWVFTQLAGLASAIDNLHNHIDKHQNCRHGDLKPENILCFENKNKPGSLNLVITDVGLAKLHGEATEWRSTMTSSTSTIKYQAPELDKEEKGPTSRRFDIWSLGCISLEFIIWLLYQEEGLSTFNKHIGEKFYQEETDNTGVTNRKRFSFGSKEPEKKPKTFRLHDVVQDSIDHIRAHQLCADGTALRLLVELIAARMLKVDVESKAQMKKKSKHLAPLEEKSDSTIPTRSKPITKASTTHPEVVPAQDIPIIKEPDADGPDLVSLETFPGLQRSFTLDSEASRDPKYRAYAPEIKESLDKILDGLREGSIKPFGGSLMEDQPATLGESHQDYTETDGYLGAPEPTRVG